MQDFWRCVGVVILVLTPFVIFSGDPDLLDVIIKLIQSWAKPQ